MIQDVCVFVITVSATGCQTLLREVKPKWLSWADDNNLTTDTHTLVNHALTQACTQTHLHTGAHTDRAYKKPHTDMNEHVFMHIHKHKRIDSRKFSLWQAPITWIFQELVYINHPCSHTWIRVTVVCAGSNHHVMIIMLGCYAYSYMTFGKSNAILIPFHRYYAI